MIQQPDASDRLYAALLRLFPRAFRERFGPDMIELFRDRRRDAWRRGGWPALALAWTRAIADVVQQAASERLTSRRRRAGMPTLPPSTHSKEGRMSTFLHDWPFALRSLVRQPGFFAVALLTLALGIGANTAIFTVVHAVLLAPLPYPEPDRLVFVDETDRSGERLGVSLLNFFDWRERSRSIESAAVRVGQSVNLTGRAEPDRVRGAFSSSDFLPMLAATAHLGRLLTRADDVPGAPRAVVLAYETWQQRFAGDRAIVGQMLHLNNEPYTVVGVASPGVWFPFDETDLWLPAHNYPDRVMERDYRAYRAIARLKPGIGHDQARQELDAVGRGLAQEYPRENAGRTLKLTSMHEVVSSGSRRSLLILLGAVGFVLLIACVNLANLLLARGAGRQRELAVRAALGATRGRLIAQLLTESVLLAAIGGAAGLCLAYWSVPLIAAWAPLGLLPVPQDALTLGWPVIAFAIGLSALTGLVFGTLPSVRLSRGDLQERLRDGVRAGDGVGTQRVRSMLVVAEVALSLMLLVGAGLLTRSLLQLLSESPGFETEQLFSLEYRLPQNKYRTAADQSRFHEQVVERVRQVPGVTSATLARGLAFSGNGGSLTYRLPDRNDGTTATEYVAQSNIVMPDYFETMGIPLLQGRTCRSQDAPGAPLVAIVNQQLAERVWPGRSAVGEVIAVKDMKYVTATVIGVVGNTKHWQMSDQIRPQIYGCFSQTPGIFATLIARTGVEPMSLERAVKAAIWSIDRDQPVWKVRTVESLMDVSLAPRRFEMWLMIGTAVLALLLAVLGIYGVMSYMVSQRTREIGVRMALGAARRDIARLVVGRALLLTSIGLVLGALGARALARVLGTMLYGVTASDVPTYVAVGILLMAVAMLASYLPARRAMRVDPVHALRTD